MRGFALSFALVLFVALPGVVSAQEGSGLIDNFDDWSAFAVTENGAKVCYAGSIPKKEVGDYTKRGDTYVLVTHRPAEKRIGEVSVTAGYAYQENGKVIVDIDGVEFELFTDGENAWAWDKDRDEKLVAAMKMGLKMVVKGTSSRGTETTDTYSLKGFTAALSAANAACGLE